MDSESKQMLKRDLFVQGLRLKWQEKVLPSAETFADALHQARAVEEQEKQLYELHKTTPKDICRAPAGALQISFVDALHQAQAEEEQEKQLYELHKTTPKGTQLLSKKNEGQAAKTPTSAKAMISEPVETPQAKESAGPPRVEKKALACFLCGSMRHKYCQCPQRKPLSKTVARSVACISETAEEQEEKGELERHCH